MPQNIIDLIRSLPTSSAENEKGFSQMKLVKTDKRSRMQNTALNDLIIVQMTGQTVD